MKRRALASIALVAVLAIVAPARGDAPESIEHKVRKGDTLELLAAEYYGDRNHQIFIMVANGLQHPRALVAGERLKVPASREIIADVGDTFDSIAAAYLGDARRGRFLAAFNGVGAEDSLAAGTLLSIPFQITHTAAGTERLADISAAYFGDTKNAALLRDYNFLLKDSLAPGESIVVPIHHVRVRSSKLPPADKAAKERSEKRRKTQEDAQEVLPEARAAWRQGDFGAIKRELTKIDLDFLDESTAIEIGVLLGGAYVATRDADSAMASFRRVLERRPTHALDAYTYSPKIRDVWKRAGGAVTTD
jgi:LysM repeat protein